MIMSTFNAENKMSYIGVKPTSDIFNAIGLNDLPGDPLGRGHWDVVRHSETVTEEVGTEIVTTWVVDGTVWVEDVPENRKFDKIITGK